MTIRIIIRRCIATDNLGLMKKLLGLFAILILFCKILIAADGATLDNTQGSATAHLELNGDYIFKEQIDLNGEKYVFPNSERIIFVEGANIKNGKVQFSPNTYEIIGPIGIFENLELVFSPLKSDQKVSLQAVNARWFGCYGHGDKDETDQLECALRSAHNLSIPLKIPRGTYLISRTLELKEGDILMGEFAGQVGVNNQKGQTIVRNTSSDGDFLIVSGNHVEIQNLMLVCSKHYALNGIYLKGGAVFFNMRNVLIGNANYAIYSVLEGGKGVSECKWEDVVVRNAVRGISDMNKDKGQYLTYNNIYNTTFLNIKEYGVYLHSRVINTQTFRDCLFANVGYGQAYDRFYSSSLVYAIFVNNEDKQRSVNVDGGYFENIYYSKDGKLARIDDANNAVFSFKNINCSISNVRFANTRTIVDAQGYANIKISNCIDNGYIEEKLPKAFLCRKESNAVVDVNGYSFSNRDKGFIQRGNISSEEIEATITRVLLSNRRMVNTIE